jgi:hypothetical protein
MAGMIVSAAILLTAVGMTAAEGMRRHAVLFVVLQALATLHPLRVPAAHPVSVRPERLSVPSRSLQPDRLALLRHLDHSFRKKG